MRGEINLFFNALLFYSRIRVPKWVECTEKSLNGAFRYFPLVGLLVGAIAAGIFYTLTELLPISVAVMGAMVVMLLLTGALHEDGLADFADGFGAGGDKEQILRIMKDSHIGTYGVLTLIISSMLKFMLISSLGGSAMIALWLIAAQGASRVPSVIMLRVCPYLKGERSKSSHASLGVSSTNIAVAVVTGLLPAAILGWAQTAIYIAVMGLLIALYRNFLRSKIGGCTGDTLGALQQVSELLLYAVVIIYAGL
ncbi:MAG: adenosylcobinamide-GDP ribazoletransferase [Rikenellaceae bacterium]